METQIIKGYKALNKDMSSAYHSIKYEVGKQYHLDGELGLCTNGYHFCENMINVSRFYNLGNSRIFEIEASGNILKDDYIGICCADNIRLIRELSEDEIITIINKNYNNKNVHVRTFVAKSKYASSKTLEILSKDKNSHVRDAVAENPNIDMKLLEKLSKCILWHIRRSVARNPKITNEILTRLANDDIFYVRHAIAENSKADAKILEYLSNDEEYIVRHAVAKNPNTNVKVLKKLSNDEDSDVRFAVVRNPQTETKTLEKLKNDETFNVYYEACEKLEKIKKTT